MSLELRAPGAALEIRRIPADFLIVGASYDFPLEIVATEDHDTALIAFESAGYAEISTDAGANFDPIPADVESGFDLGAFTADQRKAVVIRLTVPPATEIRRSLQGIELGIGV